MAYWRLHWLEASGDLSACKAAITDEMDAVRTTLAGIPLTPRLDILIQSAPGLVIPEIGMAGRAYSTTLLSMAVDPGNPNLLTGITDGTLRRQMLHEVHHCLRMAGPGYGWTLGEALVSEGLAGQFVTRLLDSEPELWERAVDITLLREAAVDRHQLNSNQYDHSAWFFGSGALPRWYGYTLGYQMVAAWLCETGRVSTEQWVTVSADEIIAAAVAHKLIQD